MAALSAVRRGLHLAEEGVHLRDAQGHPGAHARVAGEGAANMVDALAQGEPFAELGDLVGEIAQELRQIEIAQQGRRLADDDDAGAESLEDSVEYSILNVTITVVVAFEFFRFSLGFLTARCAQRRMDPFRARFADFQCGPERPAGVAIPASLHWIKSTF